MMGMEAALFRACTTIKLGNGTKCSSGKTTGSMGKPQKTLCQSVTNWLGGRIRMYCSGNDGCGVYNE
jgi:hypothetical protein